MGALFKLIVWLEDYSKSWHVWDSCPTQTQREAETWGAETWDA